jgi:hypothetical protein
VRFLRLLSDGTDLTPRFAPGRAANEDLIQWHVRPLIAQLGRHTLIAFRFQRFSDALRIATRCVTLLQNNPHVIRERLAKDVKLLCPLCSDSCSEEGAACDDADESSGSLRISHVVVAF